MNGQRQELARLCFKGALYDGHALDTVALQELVKFQTIALDIAKAIWRKRNPNREHLPQIFDKHMQLVLRNAEDGSTVIFLEQSRDSDQSSLMDVLDEIREAITLMYNTCVALNDDESLPADVPKQVLPKLATLGKALSSDSEILFAPEGRQMVLVSPETREKLSALISQSYEDEIEVTGRVLEANVRQKQFQLWMDNGTNFFVTFNEEQEGEVTTALKEHDSLQLFVRGRGEFSEDGVLQRVKDLKNLKVITDNGSAYDKSAPKIGDEIARIFSDVSDQEWENVPRDLSHRHDFYLYGEGKQ